MTGTDDQPDDQTDEATDDQPDEETDEETDEEPDEEPDEATDQERLDRLQGDIEGARTRAKDADLLDESEEDERELHESGDEGEDLDD